MNLSLVSYAFLPILLLCATAPVRAEIELPFHWKGKGEASILTYNGLETVEFNLEVRIDPQGQVEGSTFTEEGGIPIERLFYGPEKDGARDAIVVTVLHDNQNPTLFILKGRMLYYQLYFAEVLTKRYEREGEVESLLKIGTRQVEGYPAEMPADLQRALNACQPIGCVKIIAQDEVVSPEPVVPSAPAAVPSSPAAAQPASATPESSTPEVVVPESVASELPTPASATPEAATAAGAVPASATPESATPAPSQ